MDGASMGLLLFIFVLLAYVVILLVHKPKMTLAIVEKTIADARFMNRDAKEGIWWMRKTMQALNGVDTTVEEIKAQKAERRAVVDQSGLEIEEAERTYLEALDEYKKAVLDAKTNRDGAVEIADWTKGEADHRLKELAALEELLS